MSKTALEYWEARSKGASSDSEALGIPGEYFVKTEGIEGKTIIDAGCGYGRRAIPLAREGREVIAIDVSSSVLSRLKKNLCENVHPIQASLLDLPLRNQIADSLLCSGTLYYINPRLWRKANSEFARVANMRLVQYRNLLNLYNLKRRVLRCRPVEYATLPSRLEFSPLFWKKEARLTHWRKYGIRFTSLDHTQEYFKDVSPEKDAKEIGRGDVFTFWQRKWLYPSAKPLPYPILKTHELALLPLTNYDDWFSSLDKKVRNRIRHSMEAKEVTREQGLAGLTEIYSQIQERQGRKFEHDLEHIQYTDSSFFAMAGSRGIIRIIPQGNFGIIASFISSEFQGNPNDSLLSCAVKWACAEGLKLLLYDYMDSGSLGFFKKRHGFQSFPIERYAIPLSLKGKLAIKVLR